MDLDTRQISQAAFSSDERLLAVVSWLGFAQVWETEGARPLATLRGFLQGQHSAAFSPTGDRLAIGSNAREAVKLWNVDGFQELLTLEGNGSLFMSVAFSPDGNVLAASNGKGSLHIWRALSFAETGLVNFGGR
jgi:WD40 repeat protein